jgi:DNA-binding transcriptional ArsR family regulator
MRVIDLDGLSARAVSATRYLKAFANYNRLIILCNLMKQEMSVGELERAVGLSLTNLSQQLARLRSSKLVASRRDGRSIYYSIADVGIRSMLRVLHGKFCVTVRVNGRRPARRWRRLRH